MWWVNLTNVSNPGNIISKQIINPIAVDTPTFVQLTGLTPGQTYRLNITPLNTSISGSPVVYTHSPDYTAPLPEITFEYAITRPKSPPIPSLSRTGTRSSSAQTSRTRVRNSGTKPSAGVCLEAALRNTMITPPTPTTSPSRRLL